MSSSLLCSPVGRCTAQAPFQRSSKAISSRGAASRSSREPQRIVTCSAARDSDAQQSTASAVQGFLRNTALSLAAVAALSMPAAMLPPQLMAPAEAGLLAVDPVKNARALLRNSLPVNNKVIRDIQNNLESVTQQLRIPGSKSLGPIGQAVRRAQGTLNANKGKLEAAFAPGSRQAGLEAIEQLDAALKDFTATVDANDKQAVPEKQQAALTYVGDIEQAMVKGFPFTVPSEYNNLPQLKGRATLEMGITLKTARDNGITGGKMLMVVDGYNAPVSAGNFVDLAQRKFYDGLTVQRADGFIIQTGDPDGPATGFVDEKTGKNRTVPFELMVQGDKVPVYEETLEDNGRFNEQPTLPFNAYGTMAWARSEFEANDASSQFFFLLKESELTPTGSNLLDGRFAVFGYVVDNADLLGEMQVGDKINYVKVVDGLENLQKPKGGEAAAPAAEAAPEAASS